MVKNKTKILGITISISWVSLISLVIFMKALGIKYQDLFYNNVNLILILSGGLVLFLIAIGAISISSLLSKGKGLVSD